MSHVLVKISCLLWHPAAEMEALEQQKKAKEEAAATSATAPNTSAQPFTPDYAAGLMAPATPVSVVVVYLACTPVPSSIPHSCAVSV